MDSLVVLFDTMRVERPPVWDADRFGAWERSIGQILNAFTKPEQQWGCKVLIANDLCQSLPGLPLSLAYARVEQMMKIANNERTLS